MPMKLELYEKKGSIPKPKQKKQSSHPILGMGLANERRRYIVTSSLIGWAHAQCDPLNRVYNSWEVLYMIATVISLVIRITSNTL